MTSHKYRFLPDSLAGTLDSGLHTSCTLGSSSTCFHLQPQHKKHPGGKHTHTHRRITDLSLLWWWGFPIADTHPVTLITTDKKWNFVRYEISAGNTTVTPSHQQHPAFHHSSHMRVTPSYRNPTCGGRKELKASKPSTDHRCLERLREDAVQNSLSDHLSPMDTHWWQPRW